MFAKLGEHATTVNNIVDIIDTANISRIAAPAFIAGNSPLFHYKELKVFYHRSDGLQFIDAIYIGFINRCTFGSVVNDSETEMSRI